MGSILQKNLAKYSIQVLSGSLSRTGIIFSIRQCNAWQKRGPGSYHFNIQNGFRKILSYPGDEIETLDLNNMTEIIRAIGLSAGSIIAGTGYSPASKT